MGGRDLISPSRRAADPAWWCPCVLFRRRGWRLAPSVPLGLLLGCQLFPSTPMLHFLHYSIFLVTFERRTQISFSSCPVYLFQMFSWLFWHFSPSKWSFKGGLSFMNNTNRTFFITLQCIYRLIWRSTLFFAIRSDPIQNMASPTFHSNFLSCPSVKCYRFLR